MSKEGWQSRGWCRFERVCREFLCPDSNIAVIESPQHWYLSVDGVLVSFEVEDFEDSLLQNATWEAPRYVMTPFDSWLRPACMGLFTVEDDRDKVPDIRKKCKVLFKSNKIIVLQKHPGFEA